MFRALCRPRPRRKYKSFSRRKRVRLLARLKSWRLSRLLNDFIRNRRFELGLLRSAPRGSFILRGRKYGECPTAPGFLGMERNMSRTVSKASRIDSRGETIADPISISLFGVLELHRAISRRRLSPKCVKIRETVWACGRKSEEFAVLETRITMIFCRNYIFLRTRKYVSFFNNESNIKFRTNVIVFIYITSEFYFFPKR